MENGVLSGGEIDSKKECIFLFFIKVFVWMNVDFFPNKNSNFTTEIYLFSRDVINCLSVKTSSISSQKHEALQKK